LLEQLALDESAALADILEHPGFGSLSSEERFRVLGNRDVSVVESIVGAEGLRGEGLNLDQGLVPAPGNLLQQAAVASALGALNGPPLNLGQGLPFDESLYYRLPEPIVYRDLDGQLKSIDRLSGADLNYAARVVYAEAAGSQMGGTIRGMEAVASTLVNRLGAMGVKKGPQSTLRNAALNGEYEAATRKKPKFVASENPDSLPRAERVDYNMAAQALWNVLWGGKLVPYTAFRGGGRGRPLLPGRTVIEGNHFFRAPRIERKR